MQNFLKKLHQKFSVRTLRVDILTLFLSLIIITFSCVILYSYIRNYTGIKEYSKKTMQRISATIIEKIKYIGLEVESTLVDSSGILLFPHIGDELNNPSLIDYMINVTDFNIDISAFALAFPNGEVLQINDIPLTTQSHFMTEPAKPLPPNSRFIVKKTKISPTPGETWTYLDKNRNIIATEKLPFITINIQDRPWYQGAIKSSNIYWTPIHKFSGTQELGVSAGKAIYNSQGKLMAVLGINLSFVSLSKFIYEQKVSRSGKVFVVDEKGHILLPEPKYLSTSSITQAILDEAWKKNKKYRQENFMFEYKSDNYLVFISDLPTNFGEPWSIVVVAPFLDFFSDLIFIQVEIILITLIILIFAILIITYFSKRISNPIVTLSREIDKITNLDFSSKKPIHSQIVEINMMAASIAAMRNTIRSFSRYVPKEIVRQLLHRNKNLMLKVDKKTLTILFTDIKNFTSFSEESPLDTLMENLSAYFDGLSKIILANNGTIDKYIGDSIMAFWGAPLDDPNQIYDACLTALSCALFLKRFNQKNLANNQPPFYTRFGINTGEILVGNIGTKERMNYTVIGDPVNLASRLESAGKIYQVEIIISEQVYQHIKEEFLCRPLDKVVLKGKNQETEIYQLVALKTPGMDISAKPLEIELCQKFTQAYQAFKENNLPLAKELFQEIQEKFPEDHPTQLFLQKL